MFAKANSFDLLAYDSEEDEYKYETNMKKQQIQKEFEKEQKKLEKEQQRIIQAQDQKIKEDNKYNQSLRRTKIYDGLIPRKYVKLIEEDNYDISSYLSLSRDISYSLYNNNMACALTYGGYQIFDNKEYLYLVEIMEQAKNHWYYNPQKQLKDMMSISEERMMKCYFNINKYLGYGFAAIYQIYKFLLWDTPNYRALLKDKRYSTLKETIDKDLKDFIENPYDIHSEIEQKYVSKYFELGKRYYAKRNNFKILFRNYILFIGKMMVINKRR